MFKILLALHIFSAAIFIGNMVTAAFWKVRADRSGSLEAMAAAARGVLMADYAFTIPGAGGLVATGLLMVAMTGWERLEEPWLAASLALLLATGVLWLVLLVPLQRNMARISEEAVRAGVLEAQYAKISRRWAIFGGIATLLPVMVLFLMVTKPGS